jgi:hypothetical protein
MLPVLRDSLARLDLQRQRDSVVAAMHLSGVRWDKGAGYGISRLTAPVYRVVGQLRRDRRGFFADGWGDVPGSSLDDLFREVPATHCSGSIRRVDAIEARDGPAAAVYGWGWNRIDDRAPQVVVIADTARTVKGIGFFVPYPYRHRHLPGQTKPDGAPWVAYINDFDPAKPYLAYGILDDRTTICPLAVREPSG